MRSAVVLLVVAAVALSVLSGATGAPASQHLVPTAVAFRDALHGEIGLSWDCFCKEGGEIAITSNGGKTWRITQHTRQRILGMALFHDRYYVELNGGILPSGRRFSFRSHCPKSWPKPGWSADLVDRHLTKPWSICDGLGGTGFASKAVYRGSKRVAYTPWLPPNQHGYGGIGVYGYPAGIAGAYGGFGIIWPGGRGSVYVTRDGGHRWHASGRVLQSDGESGLWATTVGNTGFLLVWSGGHVRLVETTDAGRHWHVVHRWR
jgi:hypothetical protein